MLYGKKGQVLYDMGCLSSLDESRLVGGYWVVNFVLGGGTELP